MAAHVRKDDEVVVTVGKDKGRRGKIIKVFPQLNRVLVQGVNIVKKHQKPGQGNRSGGIVEKEASIHMSNVMPIDPKTKEPTRVRFERRDDGTKVRVAVKSGTEL